MLQPTKRETVESSDVFFRVMTPEPDGLPRCGRTGRCLGVRIPGDIRPDPEGFVLPRSGGMSVAPGSPWNLPHHRRPRTMGRGSTGPKLDRVYSIHRVKLVEQELDPVPDSRLPTVHALVGPVRRVPLAGFERSLQATRPQWDQAWP